MRKIVVVAATLVGAAMPMTVVVAEGGSPDTAGVDGDRMKSGLGVAPRHGNLTPSTGSSSRESGSSQPTGSVSDSQSKRRE